MAVVPLINNKLSCFDYIGNLSSPTHYGISSSPSDYLYVCYSIIHMQERTIYPYYHNGHKFFIKNIFNSVVFKYMKNIYTFLDICYFLSIIICAPHQHVWACLLHLGAIQSVVEKTSSDWFNPTQYILKFEGS